MTSRRAHPPRNTRLPAHSTASPSPPRLLNSHTFTLIASWRGQLLICTVVLAVGAIYFVLREPIKQWRRRQRERLSRALTAELLSLEKHESSSPSDEKELRPLSSSKCISTALPATPKTARERGREKRKEAKEAKKRSTILRSDSNLSSAADTVGIPTSSSLDSSPVLAPVTSIDSTPEGDEPSELLLTADAILSPPTITLESTPSDTDASRSPPSTASPIPQSLTGHSLPMTDSPLSITSRRLPSALEVDLSTDGDEPCSPPTSEASRQPSTSSRPTYSRQPSSSYSIMPDEGYLPATPASTRKKNKRKSKARGGSSSEAPRTPALPKMPSISALRTVNMSSDDASSPHSVSAILSSTPGSPPTPRRRRKNSIGGVPMTPALDLLLTNHERTIDSLRAEIGYAKAEESKARDDEVRAREELRRSRTTEDRMRSDYERARKARDRAENETRRIEAEMLLMRNRFDTLSHMYHAVCNRLRDFEIIHATAAQTMSQNGDTPSSAHPTQSPAATVPSSPFLAYPTMGGLQMFMPYGNGMYASPAPPHFAMHPPVSPSPLRRTEGSSTSDLAGPLTPGIGPSASSQMPSPFTSDLTINTPASSTSPSASTNGELSAAELRRLHIASSVLKKKTPASDSGESNPTSTRVSEGTTEGSKSLESIAGLGITQLSDMSSTFPSVNGTDSRPTPVKQGSLSSSTSSSDASSAPPGRILTTPSAAQVFPRSGKIDPLTIMTETAEVFVHDIVHEPDSVDHSDTPTDNDTVANGTCTITLEKEPEACLSDPINDHDRNDNDHSKAAPADPAAPAADAEYAPMFASLAHTPEQLVEIARIRESAIRDRERRSRQRSTDSHDL